LNYYFTKKIFGLHFGRFSHKHSLSPCLQICQTAKPLNLKRLRSKEFEADLENVKQGNGEKVLIESRQGLFRKKGIFIARVIMNFKEIFIQAEPTSFLRFRAVIPQ
jgi:hypothetical protein